ncbi:protein translocase subunit SecF [Paenibacillus bovis]|uniref:Protein-export membrane protein SecF n=1 Tax=Paenibacillus bovis TaxID=1616788 RepID=A0A172ZK87_9BACL|nr:protein translocase subunit SecF [Paenibacillus bovis]ANF98036.1 protein-export membrane protein SecF [Paenibacillus bovis]
MRFKWNYDFVKLSKYFYTFSIILTIAGIISLAVAGLNYGVDFRSGSNVDVTLTKPLTEAQVAPVVESLNLSKDPSISVGGDGRMSIRFETVLTDTQENQLKQAFNKQLDSGASFEVNTVDPTIAKELERNALWAVLLASLGIIIYVTIRFEWRFAVASVVALLHDAFLVISVFSIFRLEVDLTFITAVLTIIGYSLNDTIVIFDRIRSNLRFAKQRKRGDVADIVNKSISQTMTRSLNTVLTVFIACLLLFIMGSESIRMFSLAMMIGLAFGAYSSIFIASPLWLVLKNRQKPKAKAPSKTTA